MQVFYLGVACTRLLRCDTRHLNEQMLIKNEALFSCPGALFSLPGAPQCSCAKQVVKCAMYTVLCAEVLSEALLCQ